jgi:serine/threonine-protein kinase HipA
MKLNVFINGQPVAILDSPDGFEHVLTYRPEVREDDFVSLLMPVRTESWTWPSLHPFFQMNLPEGFLLTILKEQLGPLLGARPLEILAVVGTNTIGRVQVSASDDLDTAGLPTFNLAKLLHGDNSPAAFVALVREYARSGVSGVVPKFLAPETEVRFKKASLALDRRIIKGSSDRLPFVALNEHLCMEVARQTGYKTAQTHVSDDGQALVVERFDIERETGKRLGFEDACSLLGLPPEDKYQSTWERVARLTRDFVANENLRAAQEQLAVTLLLTYALGNADCHTKNLGYLYTSKRDVRIAPIYDMLSIRVYDFYADNPPGMAIDGRKTWTPGQALWRVLQQHFGIEPKQQRELTDKVATAISSVVPELIHRVHHTPGFGEIGTRMLWEWDQGLRRLNDRVTVQVPNIVEQATAAGIKQAPRATQHVPARFGESPLLASRRRKKVTLAS